MAPGFEYVARYVDVFGPPYLVLGEESGELAGLSELRGPWQTGREVYRMRRTEPDVTKRMVHQLYVDVKDTYRRRLPGSRVTWVMDDRCREVLTVKVTLGLRHRFVAWGPRLIAAELECGSWAYPRGYVVDVHVAWTPVALRVGAALDAVAALMERLMS